MKERRSPKISAGFDVDLAFTTRGGVFWADLADAEKATVETPIVL